MIIVDLETFINQDRTLELY